MEKLRSIPARALRRADRRLQILAEDLLARRHGIATRRSIPLDALGVPDAGGDRIWHHPSGWLPLRRVLRQLDPGPGDAFADIGSGLGAAVVLAARYPFGRVIGVELSDELTRAARANVERTRAHHRCDAVELVCADATEWPVPDELTVAYMYSPVTGELFDRVVANLLASIDRRPRLLRLVYNYPVENARLLATGRAVPVAVAPGKWPARLAGPADAIVTYVLLDASGEPPDAAARALVAAADVPLEWTRPHDPGFVLEPPASASARVGRPAAGRGRRAHR